MVERLIPVILLGLLAVIHSQMWFGRGSVPSVTALQQQVDDQRAANAHARLVNNQLASEVDDLKTGLGMVEEKARMELGMVRSDEIFVQVTAR